MPGLGIGLLTNLTKGRQEDVPPESVSAGAVSIPGVKLFKEPGSIIYDDEGEEYLSDDDDMVSHWSHFAMHYVGAGARRFSVGAQHRKEYNQELIRKTTDHEEEAALRPAPRLQGEGVNSIYQTFGTPEFHAVEAALFEDEEISEENTPQYFWAWRTNSCLSYVAVLLIFTVITLYLIWSFSVALPAV